MCCSPIIIKNPSRKYRDGIDKMFFRVPCGHCKECIKSQQDDWFVRAFFEWKRIEALGGCVFFPTLTFRDEDLPIYSDELRGYTIPCFDGDKLKKFRDNLRIYLVRFFTKKILKEQYKKKSTFVKKTGKTLYYYSNDDKRIATALAWQIIEKLRFIIVSEFGGKRGRSHHHALIFCPFQISDRDMLHILRHAWRNGWIGVSKKGLRLEGLSGLQYAMKYVSKDQYWLKKYHVDDYIAQLKEEIENGREESEDDLKAFRRVLPKHYQSTHFGENMVDAIVDDNEILIKNLVDLSKFGFVTKNKFEFKIPRYIYRKIMEISDIDGLPSKSDKYKELMNDIFQYQLYQNIVQLAPFTSYDNFKNYASLIHLKDEDINLCWSILDMVKDKHFEMSIFNLVYRDVPCSEHTHFVDLYSESLDFLCKQKINYSAPRPVKKAMSVTDPEFFSPKRHTYNDLPEFNDFSRALHLIETLTSYQKEDINLAWIHTELKNASTYRVDETQYFSSI